MFYFKSEKFWVAYGHPSSCSSKWVFQGISEGRGPLLRREDHLDTLSILRCLNDRLKLSLYGRILGEGHII